MKFLLTFFYIVLRGMNIADPHWSERGVCEERCSCLGNIISTSHSSRDWWEVILLSPINLNTSENPRKVAQFMVSQSKWQYLELVLAGWVFSQGIVCSTGMIYLKEQCEWNKQSYDTNTSYISSDPQKYLET